MLDRSYVQAKQELITEECYSCGMIFGIPSQLQKNLRGNHESFYCPNGHPQSYVGKTEAEKAHEELAAVSKRLQDTLARENELRVTNDRLKKRIATGVCPCCKRSFKQLAAHMKNKHPNYK